ncbi:BtpA/SgcQ family protein [Enterococcus wangshanyuanii]|uniref:Photosystem I biogenesis protein BtpA n=1 Tax=Enterococcus wangshanyuanii TaxID=2005703 RepID=A0ABQ1PQ94_9ENTE|nr:BtpA/SgcQ family protein [Enterococcus wangshanyuanii]GGD00871.1 photosystem I biogenesis protein BtpA [Enterococcus wangshanyuanii]
MSKKTDFLAMFSVEKPIIGVIHLKGETEEEIQERAKKEIQIYVEQGIDGILMENYYGDYVQLEKALQYITSLNLSLPIGVNVLNMDPLGFHLANKYDLQFLQIDSVVGHVKPRDEASLQEFFNLYRAKTKAKLIGGVRFKYQPLLSEKSVEADLHIAQKRCDAIAVTENATGEETSMEKIELFRRELPEFPLIVAAGLNDNNVKEQLAIGDAAIVGSNFKDTRKDTGDIYAPYVASFMKIVKEVRGEQA